MITLHKKKAHISSEKLESRLENLVIAFKKEIHGENESGLPFIVEDGIVYKTEEEIEEWISDLTDELNWQRKLSGDGCYIDPNKGEVC